MKHTHITILKEDLERFKTACEINIGTSFMRSSKAEFSKNSVTCEIGYEDGGDIFYLGRKFERNENG